MASSTKKNVNIVVSQNLVWFGKRDTSSVIFGLHLFFPHIVFALTNSTVVYFAVGMLVYYDRRYLYEYVVYKIKLSECGE